MSQGANNAGSQLILRCGSVANPSLRCLVDGLAPPCSGTPGNPQS